MHEKSGGSCDCSGIVLYKELQSMTKLIEKQGRMLLNMGRQLERLEDRGGMSKEEEDEALSSVRHGVAKVAKLSEDE